MTPPLPLRGLKAPRAGWAAVAASLVVLAALALGRPYAGPGLGPGRWGVGLLAVGVLGGALHARDGGLREHWPVLVLAALLVPTYVDHTRRIEIGDPVHYYSSLRSMLFDADLRLANDYELLGWAGHEGENAQPIGAPLLWSPFRLLVHLGRDAARLFRQPAPDGTEPSYAATVSLATFVYGAAGLFVLMAALRRFVSPAAALWTTALCWVGSPLRFYLSVVPAMAHGIEFAAAARPLWTDLRLREASEPARVVRAAAWCGLAVGLAFLARSQDGLLLILPRLELALRLTTPPDRPAGARAIAAFGGAFALTALPHGLAWQAMFGRPFLI